jgi:hypothetical protein
MYSLRAGILNQNTVSDQSPAAARAAQPPRPELSCGVCDILLPTTVTDGRPHLAGACWLSHRCRPLPAFASGLEWRGEAGDMLGLGRGRCGGLGVHRGRFPRGCLVCSRADGGITTYVCIHEYIVFTVVFSGGRDTVLIHRIRSPCAGIHILGFPPPTCVGQLALGAERAGTTSTFLSGV